ncbi:MAG: sulfatase-like hydrolase/transferase [Leptospiraceae bacterium]|nr:sulfatase-like hydrolase/transferase [Leptospiraceae bacterium]MCP5493305.1 sulfatase-like hydrolase/transferase [Leptospiraceae bacterium]
MTIEWEKIKHAKEPVKVTFLVSLIIYLTSLLVNTSFHIMGVDIAKEISSLFNPDYVWVILTTNIKIFLTYFALLSIIYLPIEYTLSQLRHKRMFSVLALLVIILLVWFHSIVLYPQLYGEFFYVRHTYLQPFLYFLTNHTTPQFFEAIIYSIFALNQILLLFFFIEEKKSKPFLFFLLGFLFLFFHQRDSFIGVLCVFLLYLYAMSVKTKADVQLIFLPMAIYILTFIKPYYYDLSQSSLNQKHYNLILVSADSLRADKIGSQRNGKSITPNIDEFSQEAIIFQDHHVTVPRTFPSWADLLTGEYAMSHKIRDMFPAPEEIQNLGKPDFQTIGHYLRKQGFQTAVFSNFAGDIFPRADFGFEHVYAPDFNANVLIVQRNLESHALLLPFLAGTFLEGGKYFQEIDDFPSLGDGSRMDKGIYSFLEDHKALPIFISIFHSVTHFPYSPPYPYYKKFTDPNYYGKYKYFKFVDPSIDEKPSPKDIEQIRAVFDGSINAFDSNFGDLISWLKSHSLYDNSIIIVTGDHGESMFEDIHGHGHGEHLRGPYITHVPLIIKFPKGYLDNPSEINRFKGITSSIDITPTLVDFYKIPVNKTFPGKSLLPIISLENWQEERYVYSETGVWFSDQGEHFFQKQRIMYPDILKLHRVVKEYNYQIMITDPFFRETVAFAKHRAILTSRYKLIYIPTQEGVLFELYDRVEDPLNQSNLYTNDFISNQLRNRLYSLVEEKENATILGEYIFPPSVK